MAPRPAHGLWWLAIAFVWQVGAFVNYARVKGVAFTHTLLHYDANWYADLVENGRGAFSPETLGRWAFFPAHLAAVGWVYRATGWSSAVVGAALSTLASIAAVWLLGRRRPVEHAWPAPTPWGWFLLLLSPASYVLFTFHTEALFLLASVVAWLSLSRSLVIAALATAIAVLTRNQGVFLAIRLIAGALSTGRTRAALAVAAGALAAWLGLVTWCGLTTGRPFVMYEAQQLWPHATGLWEVLRTTWMGNDSQSLWLPMVVRHVYGLTWLATGAVMLWRGPRATGLYLAMSAGVMWLQGTLQNAFRFSVVCWPLFFWWGERLSKAPRPVQLAVAVLWIVLHQWVLNAWLHDRWPY